MKFGHLCVLIALGALLLPATSQAGTISINFAGNAGQAGTLGLTDIAGMADTQSGGTSFVSNWNNADGISGSLNNLLLNDGSVTDVSVSWNAREAWSNGNTTSGNNILLPGGTTGDGMQNPTMMKGYIADWGTGDGLDSKITVDGLTLASGNDDYSVIVYFDGSNGGQWRKGEYTIGATTLDGEDSENVMFNSGGGNNANGLFQLPVPGSGGNSNWPNTPNNDEGNYVIFSGLTDSSFTLDFLAGANGSTPRGPVNGIQILGVDLPVVPEPSTLVLAALGLFGMAAFGLRRKR